MVRDENSSLDEIDRERRRRVLDRLRKIEGQVRGIARMVEGNRDCEAVITQILAARAALDRAAAEIADGYVDECLRGATVAGAHSRITRIIGLLSRAG